MCKFAQQGCGKVKISIPGPWVGGGVGDNGGFLARKTALQNS